MTISLASASDPELLSVAAHVLREEGFSVEEVPGQFEIVLAENAYFVIAVAATHTIQDLILIQSLAEAVLIDRLNQSSAGPKSWDAYLVLLTQERSPEDDATTRDLYAINYNTARVRRIAHTGVDPTTSALEHSLAPFVAPIEISASEIHQDPLASLVDALVSRGVERDLAKRAVLAFEQGASLDDIF